jgi:hypothetical protein
MSLAAFVDEHRRRDIVIDCRILAERCGSEYDDVLGSLPCDVIDRWLLDSLWSDLIADVSRGST